VYVGYLQQELTKAREKLKREGNRRKNYSLEVETRTLNGKTRKINDTVWFSANEEEVKAVESLIRDLTRPAVRKILQPEEGLYLAARLYGADQKKHSWQLLHQGSDGSWPDARIKRCAPQMTLGNENIAGKFPEPSPRDIVLQLLIDSGIRGYGHRYNILNPKWTHVACFCGGLTGGLYWWLQEFGQRM